MDRNKRAVTRNLSHPAGRELLERLAADADVLVENLRPGVLEKWDLGPHRMHPVNPALVILRVAGSGQIGPGAARGLPAAPEIADVSDVRHLSMGGVDLRKDLGTDGGYLQMPYTRSRIVAAPRRRSTASTCVSTTICGCGTRPSSPARSASPASPRSIRSNSTSSTTCSPHPRGSSPGHRPCAARSPPPTATRSGCRTVNSPTFRRRPRPALTEARRPAPGRRGRTRQNVPG